MSSHTIVFLDRATIGNNIVVPQPTFTHRWIDYSHTFMGERESRLQGVECVLTNKVVIDAALLNACPDIKYIGVTATGFNVVDIDACRERGIVVTNVKGYSTDGVAEHVMLFILALRKQLKAYQQSLLKGDWQRAGQFVYFHEPLINVKGSTLGLIGTGAIAQATARLAAAFGMHVLYHSPSGRRDVEGSICVPLNTLLEKADVVSLHCPLTEQTEQLINAEALSKMKTDALLINTARGPIVDTDALIGALRNGKIGGAGLDVLPIEPPDIDAPIMAALDLPQLIVTPHTAWGASQSQTELMAQVIQNLESFVAGTQINNLAG